MFQSLVSSFPRVLDLIGVVTTIDYQGPALAEYFGWHATSAQDTSLNRALSSLSQGPLPSDLYLVSQICVKRQTWKKPRLSAQPQEEVTL